MKLGEATKKSFEDKELSVADLPNFLTVIPYLQPALDGVTDIVEEIKDLDASEVEELLDLVAKDLGVLVSAPKLITQINAALKLVKAAKEFYETVK